jgi:plastocyanin
MNSRPIAAALAVFALTLAGCGGDDEPAAESAAQPPAQKAAGVEISDFKYAPEAVRVKAGATVTWSNSDKAVHTAQTDEGARGAFDTGDLEKGDSKKIVFERPGKISYYCIYHRFMEARVEVVE